MGLEPIRLTAADFKSAQSTKISALAVSPGWETWTLNAFALGFEPSPYTNSGNPGNILLKELKVKHPPRLELRIVDYKSTVLPIELQVQ